MINNAISILIAEDSRTQAERLRFILESNGHEVRVARNGREALAMLAEKKSALVISDINMPEMDGYELCKRIKSDGTMAAVPVILVTALAETRDLLRGLECGADSYITKPYDEEDLVKSIRQVQSGDKSMLEKNTLVMPFNGERYRIENNSARILNFLMTTYDLAVKKNVFLLDANAQLHDEISERQRIEERLRRSNESLSILYKVSMITGETMQMDALISNIIKAVTTIGMLKCEPRGIIFLADAKGLHLSGKIGHANEFHEQHRTVPYGTCLCGLAAKTGEIIISTNSDTDNRHTIQEAGVGPHGHIILPLQTQNRLVGVLCLYLEPDTQLAIDDNMMALFESLGRQIGLALDNARLYEETRMSSLHDPLTGLANRRMMDLVLKKHFASAQRTTISLSIIMLDIDDFKRYNDTRGHAEGDKMLAAVARFAAETLREMDTAFRYGGEEFLILLPETSLPGALMSAERIRSAIETQTTVTISLGVASYAEGMDMEKLIVTADEALYRAKQKGRNRVES